MKKDEWMAKSLEMTNVLKLTFDAFPLKQNYLLESCSSAVISCFVSDIMDNKKKIQINEIISNLYTDGWSVEKMLSETSLRSEDLIGKTKSSIINDLSNYGYAIDVNLIDREWIYESDTVEHISALDLFQKFHEIVSETNTVYTLYSAEHGQYANGELWNKDEFLPIWTRPNLANIWVNHFPSFAVQSLPLDQYKENVLEDLNDNAMLLAISINEKYMMTAHPNSISLSW